MKIILIGYGKMGKTIEKIALKRGHEIVLTLDQDNIGSSTAKDLSKGDVAIEFSQPDSAFSNILRCFEAGIPVVCGTTGWNKKLEEAKSICLETGNAFFYASNYSIGVNVFFEINKRLAELMNSLDQYDEVFIHECHHLQKLDAPSGTAITLAEQILERIQHLGFWKNYKGDENMSGADNSSEELPIFSTREDEVPGTHLVKYISDADELEIIHKAHNREGFGLGAVRAAEWIRGKKGVFGMKDLLSF